MNSNPIQESAARPIELPSRRRLLRRATCSAAWRLVFGAVLSLPPLPLLAAEATHSAAPLADAVVKQIDGVFAEWDNTRSPGCVVGVSRGGQVVFARGYGMSNLEYDVPNTPDSIFHIASISKQFTAAAVALLVADGKLSWSVGDLLKWEHNFVEPLIGGRAFVEAMVVSGQLNNGIATGYSLGLVTAKPRGVVEVGHGGADAGYRSDVVRFPEHDLAIAVFCNLSTMQPGRLTRKVAEIVLGPGVFEPLPPAVAMSEQELKALEGAYWNELTDDVRWFSIKDGKLMAGGISDALVPIGGGRFRVGESSAQLGFPAVATGGVQELHVLSPTLPVAKFKRVVAPNQTREELAAFVGAFFSSELEATFRVVVTDDGKLEWQRSARGNPVTLQPVKRDTFTLFNAVTITFTRGSAGEVTGLTLSNGRVRRLALTKTGPEQ